MHKKSHVECDVNPAAWFYTWSINTLSLTYDPQPKEFKEFNLINNEMNILYFASSIFFFGFLYIDGNIR